MKALGIDHGEARIGLAISDDLGLLAHPLETIACKEVKNPVARIAQVSQERGVTDVVVGLPRNMDGSEGPAAQKVRAFAKALRQALPQCTVRLWDERLSTVAAQKALHMSGRNTKESRVIIDQVAAQMILQGWLDAQAPVLD